jgi:integrase
MAAPQLKQKPSGIWFVEFEGDGGERRRVSTNTRDKQIAREKMRDIVLGLDKPAPQSRSGDSRLTMSDLFDRAQKTVWAPGEAKSQATIRSNIKILEPLIGSVAVADMNYTRLEDLALELKAKGYAPATIKRKMDMISKALRMATIWTDERGRPLLAAKPKMPTIRVSNLKDRVLERHEEVAVFNAIEQRRQDEPGRQWFRFASLIRFLLDTGARLGEALNTGPEALSTRQGHRFVTFARYRTKNDKPRTVPLTPAAAEALDALMPHLGRLDDGSLGFFPMSNGTAWYMWDNIREDLKKAGLNIDDVTLHTLRHTALTRLAQGGMGLLQLQKWAGHSDPKITADRYTHLQPGDLLGGLDILSSNPSLVPSQRADPFVPAKGTVTLAGANRAEAATPLLN